MTFASKHRYVFSLIADFMPGPLLIAPRQPDYLPTGLKTLYQAFNNIGAGLFGEAWAGNELDVFSSTETESIKAGLGEKLRKAQQNAKYLNRINREATARRAAPSAVEGVGPPGGNPTPSKKATTAPDPVTPLDDAVDWETKLIESGLSMIPPPDDEARQRRDKTWAMLRDWLYTGTLPIYIFPDSGDDLFQVPSKRWGTNKDYSRFHKGQMSLDGNAGWLVVKDDELARALSGEEKASPTSESTAPSSEQEQPSNEPGRPSLAPEIKVAYEKIRDDGKIDFNAPKKRLYSPIREEVKQSLDVKDLPKGLGNEAIRTVITGLFDADKTNATPSP